MCRVRLGQDWSASQPGKSPQRRNLGAIPGNAGTRDRCTRRLRAVTEVVLRCEPTESRKPDAGTGFQRFWSTRNRLQTHDFTICRLGSCRSKCRSTAGNVAMKSMVGVPASGHFQSFGTGSFPSHRVGVLAPDATARWSPQSYSEVAPQK